MQTHDKLKHLLQESERNEYALPNDIDMDKLAKDMLAYIGSVDSELRDSLIYASFYMFFEKEKFSPQQIKGILLTAIDENHLFHGIDENGTDSVFTRAFSVLIVPIGLRSHRKTQFLSADEMMHIQAAVVRYIHEEKDMRGYVDDKGWAHALAHAADALSALALCESANVDSLTQILDTIEFILKKPRAIYAYEEDERLTTAFIEVYNRKILSEEAMKNWLEKFSIPKKNIPPDTMLLAVSMKNFMRSIYFRLKEDDPIKQTVKQYCKCRWVK
ncbi:MAG: DUF2785 domain-containing protein [Defluviitaleaceae bacterium]|nr:DUF2785 domain-containing protein [Defluviitaleaceae bacterium]